MPKISPSIARMLTIAMAVSSALADTVTLRSGEHLEGKIMKETDKDVTIEVKVSAGVVDERVVAKADIEKIDKTPPEIEAFQAIAPIQLGKSSFMVAQYDPYIRALQAYVTQYPNSARAGDVQATLKAFEDEKKRVQAGEVKINGDWISKADAEREKVQINGRIAFNYMKSQSTAGDQIGALNTFTLLEKNYPGAAVMPEAIELAQSIIGVVVTQVERAIPEQKSHKAELEKGFKTAGAADRAEMEAAYKKEQTTGDAAAAAADSGNRWAPFIPGSEKCLTSLKNRAGKEGPRLAALKIDDMKKSLEITEAARQNLASGEVEAATTALKDATKLWAANELAIRLTKQAAADLKAATAAAATPAPGTPKPATPKPKAATPKPLAAQQSAAPAADTAKAEGDDRPFFMTLPGAIGIVAGLAVVLAGANVFLKMRKRKAEQAPQ